MAERRDPGMTPSQIAAARRAQAKEDAWDNAFDFYEHAETKPAGENLTALEHGLAAELRALREAVKEWDQASKALGLDADAGPRYWAAAAALAEIAKDF